MYFGTPKQQPTEKEDDYNKVINVVSTGFRYVYNYVHRTKVVDVITLSLLLLYR